MESRYGVGINNRYALFLDQDDFDVEDEAMLKKAAETAAITKKAKDTAQKINGVAPVAPKKDTKPTPPTQTSAPSKKPEAGKPPKGEGELYFSLPLPVQLVRAPCHVHFTPFCLIPCPCFRLNLNMLPFPIKVKTCSISQESQLRLFHR